MLRKTARSAAPLVLALIATAEPGRAEPLTIEWSVPIEVARGPAYQGPWRMNESRFDYVDDATVAIADDGTIAVAWVDQSRKDVYFQSFDAAGQARFDAPVDVSGTPGVFSWLPRLVVSGREAGSVYVLWQEIVFSGGTHGGEIYFARSRNGGAAFDEPINLSNSIAGDGKGRLSRRYWHNGSLDLAIGAAGTLYAAWTEYEGALWFSRSTDGGRQFSAPLRIVGGGDALPARGPSIAVDAADVVHLAWTVGEDPRADIRIASSRDSGRTFSAPRIPLASDGHGDAPKIAVGPDGTVHLVYAESPTGPFDRYHIRYARSSDGAHTFENARDISARLPARYESSAFPSLDLDGAGNVYVLWELFPEARGRPRGLALAVSTDAGRTFTPPAEVPGTIDRVAGHNGSRQGLLMRKLAVNRAGQIAIVNSSFEEGETSHIWLIRGTSARD